MSGGILFCSPGQPCKVYTQPVSLRTRLSIELKAVTLWFMTRHCHKCGWEWTLAGQPGRSESCHGCGVDLRVCLNCVSYDLRAAYQCRDRRADPVLDKATGNFCEYFDFARRIVAPKDKVNDREASAREQVKKLLGD